jgi:hypothetical protein
MIPMETIGVMETVNTALVVRSVLNLNSNFLLIILIKVKTQKPYYHGNMDGI